MSSRLCDRTVCYHDFSGNSENPFATQFTTHEAYGADSPKNAEIALVLATNRGCVVKYVSQKRNESNDRSQ